MLGERDNGLSGGQHRRIAIARDLTVHPPMLIFHEVTSTLGRTVFIIARRLSRVRKADRTTCERVCSVEECSHDRLIHKSGKIEGLDRNRRRLLSRRNRVAESGALVPLPPTKSANPTSFKPMVGVPPLTKTTSSKFTVNVTMLPPEMSPLPLASSPTPLTRIDVIAGTNEPAD